MEIKSYKSGASITEPLFKDRGVRNHPEFCMSSVKTNFSSKRNYGNPYHS